ncbi:DUF6464 family protein [Oculatella sp. LEGE 06141]|nr:DUF6464 family protein [Oculatella sp. LEGE 06141]
MAVNSLAADVILSHSCLPLGHLYLDWNPQPGMHLYGSGVKAPHQLRSGRCQLHRVVLYVQLFDTPAEKSLVDGRWIMGDSTCLYNARSELLRCAVNPSGCCDRCVHYVTRSHSLLVTNFKYSQSFGSLNG